FDQFVHADDVALQVEDKSSLAGGQQAFGESFGDVAHVLEIHEAGNADLKRLSQSHGLHGERRVGSEAAVATYTVDSPRTQSDTRNAIAIKKHTRISFIRLLEDAIVRGGFERILLGEFAAAVSLLRAPYGGGTGIDHAHRTAGIARRLEDIEC